MDEKVDYGKVVEQLQLENERLREQLVHAKLMKGLDVIKHYASLAFDDVFFWVGFLVAAFIMLLAGSIYDLAKKGHKE